MVLLRREPGLIFLAVAVNAVITTAMTVTTGPIEVSIGRFVLILCTVFLIQTLIRDLWLYVRASRSHTAGPATSRSAQCFCMETALGICVLLVGLMLYLLMPQTSFTPGVPIWVLSLALIFTTNYLLRDMVFSWNPWRLYRDPDHLNIIPVIRRR